MESLRRPKVGLALSGGAARGFAHLGVLRAFEKHSIPIDFIAGTSAGSFAGAAYAAGMSTDEIEKLGQEISWYRVSSLSWSAKGLVSNLPIAEMIRTKFPAHKFEDLRIPFAAVATDLETGTEKVFSENGDVGFAVCASCAIPGVFAPLQDEEGRMFVDGGVVSPVPTEAVRAMGADIVIAVDVISSGATYWGRPQTIVGILLQSGLMLIKTAAENQTMRADVPIIPAISHLRPDEMAKMDEFVRLGEEAAMASIERISELIENGFDK
ncbi:MAG: patatin-like phospholipase family protein [Pyrinomonadaceae bacterium]